MKGYGTLSSVNDPTNGFDAGSTWAAVSGTVGGKKGIYTAKIGS